MTLRSIFLLLGAMAAAGSTALYAKGWITAERAAILASIPEEKEQTPDIRVLVAKENLSPGSFVKPAHLEWRAWPKDGVAKEYVVSGERKIEDFADAVVRNAVVAGQPVTDSLVVHPGDRGFLAAVLEPGKRAVSVPVNATSGIAGFVFPGDRVDVILTMRTRFRDEEDSADYRHFSRTLFSGIRILAIDQKVESQDGQPSVAKTATMEVTPKQAEKIALGLEMGSLSLSLHSLARQQDLFMEVAAGSTAQPVVRRATPSFTLDEEVLYRGRRGGGKHQVNVVRGTKAEVAVY